MSDITGWILHDDPELFHEAINFTAASTGFNTRFIEKDYFCTVLLAHLVKHGGRQLTFKGGTCLAKVHAGFYRLSEDLDFAVSLPLDASRKVRQQAVAQVKSAVAHVADDVPVFSTDRPLQGTNNSTQYNGAIGYHSPTTGQREAILVEVSLREPLVVPPQHAPARTLLLDPIGGQARVPPLMVNCIAMIEAMAEKFRAALSRRDVVIRDFFDLDYAVERLGLDVADSALVGLVRQKLEVPGNLPVDVGSRRLNVLHRQMDARLKTVLRASDFQAFDLNRAIGLVVDMAKRLG